MKNLTTLLGILLSTIAFGQSIDVTSSYWGDLLMRRFNAGDLDYKRAFAPIYDPSTQKSTLFMNVNSDFQNGVYIDSKTIIEGSLDVGNLGVEPSAKLNVGAYVEGQTSPTNAISIVGPNLPANSSSAQDISWDFKYAGSSKIRSYRGGNWDTNIQFLTSPIAGTNGVPSVRMHIDSEGKVGIGTTTFSSNPLYANYKLFVTGGILTDEVRVALSANGTWADYVFAKDYKLPTIKEVEKFIAKNKHLPNVPSAKQVKEEGINVADMARIQQEKIEELMLYIIKQDKRIDALEAKLLKK